MTQRTKPCKVAAGVCFAQRRPATFNVKKKRSQMEEVSETMAVRREDVSKATQSVRGTKTGRAKRSVSICTIRNNDVDFRNNKVFLYL